MSDVYDNYLFDLGRRLLSEAEGVRQTCDSLRAQGITGPNYEFQSGRALAYYEVLSMLISQAQAFGLDLTVLGLEGIDPDRLLLS